MSPMRLREQVEDVRIKSNPAIRMQPNRMSQVLRGPVIQCLGQATVKLLGLLQASDNLNVPFSVSHHFSTGRIFTVERSIHYRRYDRQVLWELDHFPGPNHCILPVNHTLYAVLGINQHVAFVEVRVYDGKRAAPKLVMFRKGYQLCWKLLDGLDDRVYIDVLRLRSIPDPLFAEGKFPVGRPGAEEFGRRRKRTPNVR